MVPNYIRSSNKSNRSVVQIRKDTKRVLGEKMDKKTFITKEKVEEVANFLKKSVEWLKMQDLGCYRYNLDSTLAIYVGWSSGWDPEDKTVIHSDTEPEFALEAAVKIRNDFDCADYEYLDFPYFEDTGECWDNNVVFKPDEKTKDYKSDAKWLLGNYVAIINEGNKKKTTLRFGR